MSLKQYKKELAENLPESIEQARRLYYKEEEDLKSVHRKFNMILKIYEKDLEGLPKNRKIKPDIKWIKSKKEELEGKLKPQIIAEQRSRRDQTQFYPRDPKVPEYFVGMEETKQQITTLLPTSEYRALMRKTFGMKEHEVFNMQSQEFLFFGDKGCGKSTFAEWVAEKMGYKIIRINCHDLYWFWNEDPRQMMKEMFRSARWAEGCVICFEEIEALETGKRPYFENSIGKTFQSFNCNFLC